jgi:hypothetical protein
MAKSIDEAVALDISWFFAVSYEKLIWHIGVSSFVHDTGVS